MKTISKKLLIGLLVLCFTFAPLGGFLAADGAHITVNLTGVQTSVSLETGELYVLPLANIFNDPSGHTLSYTLPGPSVGPQVHIADANSSNAKLVFTVANAGTYYVTVRATCTASDYAEFQMTFTVITASDGTPSQYDYNETDIGEDDTVRVYVTISNDGKPIKAYNGTILANLPVDIGYFDLAEYDLEDYYRFPTDDVTGEYISDDPEDVIKRPTALHLYLYLLENYFMNTTGDVMDYTSTQQVKYLDNSVAYTCSSQYKAIEIGGVATSLYMTNFWGNSENLMYFRNHVYPLMSAGWGATCDYALLSDGDVIELAMFSDWGFYSDGGFLRFDGYDKYASCNISRGQTLTVDTQIFDSYPGGSGTFDDTDDELTVEIYTSNGTYYGSFTWVGNSGNSYSYSLPNNMPTGLYYVVAMDPDAGNYGACMAPAVMTVNVY